MSIKHHFVRLAEKIHGRKCIRCAHNRGGKCINPKEGAFSRCWQSITRPGFEYSPSVEGYNIASAAAAALRAGMEAGMAPGDLTEQEKHELGKIVESLQEASTTAQEAGLLESPAPAIPRRDAYWDERAESGLLGEE